MIVNEGGNARSLFKETINSDFIIVGGGMSGVCCAITAAREGLKVTLVQDRPVLGGNASSEIRLWILGATSHMGNNNRWAREGGVIDEILVENTYRNPEGNPVIFDSILLEKVVQEKNITLFLNTAVYEVIKNTPDSIKALTGYCSQNQTAYTFQAPLFCDASGDGVIAFLSGAAFKMGAESREEFGEQFAPSKEYGELLGHSMYFYSKDTGQPVEFIPPSFALTDITAIPRYKTFNLQDQGCKLWWIEYGGRLDTIKDTELIKWELWRVVYGVWNYIKNSGNFPEAANYTLEWVGAIPGKRESRRFMGDYMLRQQDVVQQRPQEDAVSFGGWSIDLHPADGVFSELPGCNQWHSKGIYEIPYRCLYSKNITNLFLTGRIISASHVAFGSTRVMGTSANNAQAVAMAAVLATAQQLLPRQVNEQMKTLQQQLLKSGQFIPGIKNDDVSDKATEATITASSEYKLSGLPENGELYALDAGMAQLLPVSPGKLPVMRFHLQAKEKTAVVIHLAVCSRKGSYTPDLVLEERTITLQAGKNCVELEWETIIADNRYAFVILRKNPGVSAYLSGTRVTGVLSLFQAENKAVSNTGVQTPPEGIGMDAFEFWTPKRRPEGLNLAIGFATPLYTYAAANVQNGYARPYHAPNAWAADLADVSPRLTLQWDQPRSIQTIQLSFDTDFDHPMESVLMRHPEHVMPFCVRNYAVYDGQGNLLRKISGNYQTRNIITLQEPLVTDTLVIACEHPAAHVPAAIFEIRCY
ncbi:fumarate reductase [Niastella yeongjuensis]|uniref:Fumarate reductase n=1 Tax=Niastella yeongjuensis TaxID=354355 RepID=A0A1V9E1Q1_9BACT|nr:FAD-dependent oxidoreductase [Niastella yeongjuensis]OQP40057.1 fumarate reductase [Niastella yeongjuensis]SEO15224.1 FAD dependent oxidoreductase [Niastella yeongjuensis]